MKCPHISIIIPVYNCAKYLQRCISSLLNQSLSEFEIIIVDDCSTDQSLTIAKQIAREQPNIKVYSFKKNKKQGAARNHGLSKSKGQYVFFMDADDTLSKGALNIMLKTAINHKADTVACGVQKIHKNGTIELFHSWKFSTSGGKKALEHFASYRIGAIGCNKLFKRQFLIKNNISFFEKYFHEDIIFAAKIALNTKKYISLPDPFLNYYQHSNSTINRKLQKIHLSSYFNLYKELSELLTVIQTKKFASSSIIKTISANYGSLETYPKLIKYSQSRTNKKLREELHQCSQEIFGTKGSLMAEMLLHSLNKYCQNRNQ